MTLSPAEIARRDQALASARDNAARPGHHVIFEDRAPTGTRCSVCDCTGDSDTGLAALHREPGYHCDGCPEAADTVVIVLLGTPKQIAAAVCARHLERARSLVLSAIKRGNPRAGFVIEPSGDWRDPE